MEIKRLASQRMIDLIREIKNLRPIQIFPSSPAKMVNG
jgi:hypothetical protein